MNMATRNLKEKVTWWEATPDGFGGSTFSSPVVLNGKWQDRVEMTMSGSGKEIVSRAQVWVDQDVNIGDYLFSGESTSADPTTLDGAYPVMDFRKTTDLRSLVILRKAVL